MSEGVSLLLVDVALRGNGGYTGFGVGHAEQVISSNSSGVAVVAGNRGVNLLSFDLLVDSEELLHGVLLRLSLVHSVGSFHHSSVEGIGVGLELLLLDNTVSIFHVASPELADLSGVNGLCVAVLLSVNTNDLGSGLVVSLSVIEHSFSGGGLELGVNRGVDASVECLSSRCERGLSVSFAVEVLTLNSRHITSVA